MLYMSTQTVDPAGACIRDLRFPVSRLLGLLAAGETRESILKAYPYLESADIDAALLYASALDEVGRQNARTEILAKRTQAPSITTYGKPLINCHSELEMNVVLDVGSSTADALSNQA